MALSTADRKSLPKKVFGLPEKAPGRGSYPMPDQAHAKLAEGFAKKNATPMQQKKINAKAKKLFPGMRSASDPSQMQPLSSMCN